MLLPIRLVFQPQMGIVKETAKTNDEQSQEVLAAAKAVLSAESEAISQAESRLEGAGARNFTRAVDLILSHDGKVVVTGIGKSGHISRKIASTLRSTGTPAVFLHAAEAVHGDL